MRSVGRHALQLQGDILTRRTIYSKQGGVATRRQELANLCDHVWPTLGVASVIENRIAKQDDVRYQQLTFVTQKQAFWEASSIR